MAVSWFWSGAITPNSAEVVAKLGAAASSCRLVVSTASDLSNPSYSAPAAPDANLYVRLDVAGLAADTQHYYGVELDGVTDPLRGKLKTFPVGAATFAVAVMGDEYNKSNHRVYDAIRARAPLLCLHLGDFGYPDIATNDQAAFRTNLESVLALSRAAQLFREVPIDYVWSDHDFGPNDSDGTSPSRPAAANVYRQTVPHYALPAGAGDAPIYRAFTIGRVRFVVTDGRWGKDPNANADAPTKTMLGAAQKQWFKDQLTAAQADAAVALIVWAGDTPWIADNTVVDSWGLYSYERTELADHIKANGVTKLCGVLADTHASMYDDGTDSGYATGGGGSFPELHVAGLDCIVNSRGGPYSSGPPKPGTGVYALLTVEDAGGAVIVRWRTYSVDPATGVESEVQSYQFRRPATWPGRLRLAG